MKKIFISYKSEEITFAKELREKLISWGFDVWLDKAGGIGVGASWVQEIDKALKWSDIIVGVLTPASLASENVQNEWFHAKQFKKPLYLLWLKDIDEREVSHLYSMLQRIDFREDKAAAFEKLEETLKSRASGQAVDTPKPSPAFELPNVFPFLDLFSVSSVEELTISARWRESLLPENSDWPRVPLGIGENGKIQELYFTHNYTNNTHACITGETGSGKSELLLTILYSLSVNYDPKRVRFILIDYKGGAGFDEFENSPHTETILKKLSHEQTSAHLELIVNEIERRKTILSRGYDARIAPFPYLFVVFDEFVEFLVENPNAIDTLLLIAKAKWTYGVYLILASQSLPQSPSLAELLETIQLRIALRCRSEQESQMLLGTPAAKDISATTPGRAILKLGSNKHEDVHIAYLSPVFYEGSGTFIDYLASHIAELDSHTLKITDTWLATFVAIEDISDTARKIMQDIPTGGEDRRTNNMQQALTIPLGLVEGQAKAYYLEMENNHLLILGEQGSGKTTVLQTIAFYSSLHSSPENLGLHIFAPKDDKLHRIIGKLPHVKSLVDSTKPQTVLPKLQALEERLNRGEQGDIRDIVIIDSLTALLEANPETLERWLSLLQKGRAVGIHFVISDTSPDAWENFYHLCEQRIVLRFAQVLDYVFAIGSEQVPSGIAGRGHAYVDVNIDDYVSREIRKIQSAAPLPAYATGSTEGDAALAQWVKTIYFLWN